MHSKVKIILLVGVASVLVTVSSLLLIRGFSNYFSTIENSSINRGLELELLHQQMNKLAKERDVRLEYTKQLEKEVEKLTEDLDFVNKTMGIQDKSVEILQNAFTETTVVQSNLEQQVLELQKIVQELMIIEPNESNEPNIVVVPIPTLQEIIQSTINSVVHIVNVSQEWQGSGVAISEDIILTARHVNERGEEFLITTNDGREVKAHKAISHNKYDVGLIQIDNKLDPNGTPYLNPAELASSRFLKLAQPIYAIGSPYGKINFNSVTLGIVSGISRNYDELNTNEWGQYEDYGWSVAFTTDAAGHPGNSGCPIFTYDGKVRGILVGGFSPVLIIVMPVDLILEDIEEVKSMFKQMNYYIEEIPTLTPENVLYELNRVENKWDRKFESLIELIEILQDKINKMYDWFLNVTEVQ